MTQKIEITDEMVKKFISQFRGVMCREVPGSGRYERLLEITAAEVRAALECTLNPPREPEIEVSEAMYLAGGSLARVLSDRGKDCAVIAREMYRVMERERRKSLKPLLVGEIPREVCEAMSYTWNTHWGDSYTRWAAVAACVVRELRKLGKV